MRFAILVTLAFGVLLAGLADAQPKKKAPAPVRVRKIPVTVYEFKGGEGVDENIPPALGARLRQRIAQMPRYQLIDQSNMGVIEIDLMVTGRINKSGESDYTLIVEVLRTESTTVVGSFVETCPNCNLESLLGLIDTTAEALFGDKRTTTAAKSSYLVRPSPPVLPSKLASYLPEAGGDALVAREEALKADKVGEQTPDAAAAAWQALAEVKESNPYQSEAAKRARDWTQYSENLVKYQAQMRTDADKLSKVLVLGSVGLDEKREALSTFAKRYGSKEALALLKSMNLHPDIITELSSARVTVKTEPPGAAVRIDGVERGSTPWVGNVLSGSRTLALALDGYKPQESTVIVLPELPNEFLIHLEERRERRRWLAGAAGTNFLSEDLHGGALTLSSATQDLPGKLQLNAAANAILAEAPAVNLFVEGGWNHWGAGYLYQRAAYAGSAFASQSTPQGVTFVREAVTQEHLFRGTYNQFWGTDMALRAFGGIELGMQHLEVAAAANRAAEIYSQNKAIAGIIAGVQGKYSLGTATFEVGVRSGNQSMVPSARLLLGAGWFEHIYE